MPSAEADGRWALRKPAFVQRMPQAADDQPPDPAGVAEADFGLGGVDVDVDLLAGKIDEQGEDRVAVAGEQVLIGGADGADQQAVLHRAAVDEQILMIGDAAVEGRKAGDAAEPGGAAHIVDGEAVFGEVAVGQRRDARRPVLVGLDRQGAAAVMFEGEADIGPGHGEPLHHVEAGAIFAALGAQELAAGGDAGEQILDGDAGAGRKRGRPLPSEPAIVDDARPAVGAAHAAFDRDPGDACDRRQGLAAKAQGGHLIDRVARQLGGGVALERERDLVGRHADAVVDHLDPADAALRQGDGDSRRAGVDRVFDQLLQRAGGSFHHFTGCDTIDEMLGQAAY